MTPAERARADAVLAELEAGPAADVNHGWWYASQVGRLEYYLREALAELDRIERAAAAAL